MDLPRRVKMYFALAFMIFGAIAVGVHFGLMPAAIALSFGAGFVLTMDAATTPST